MFCNFHGFLVDPNLERTCECELQRVGAKGGRFQTGWGLEKTVLFRCCEPVVIARPLTTRYPQFVVWCMGTLVEQHPITRQGMVLRCSKEFKMMGSKDRFFQGGEFSYILSRWILGGPEREE